VFQQFFQLLIFPLPCHVIASIAATTLQLVPKFGCDQRNSLILGHPLEIKNFPNCHYPIQEFFGLKTPIEFWNIKFKTGFPLIGVSLYKGMDAHALHAPQKGFCLHPPYFVRPPLSSRAVRVYDNVFLNHPRWTIAL
jgi:hypothetical protein